jgi:hypothetical protein
MSLEYLVNPFAAQTAKVFLICGIRTCWQVFPAVVTGTTDL